MTVIGRGNAQNLDWILLGSGVIWGSLVFFHVVSEACGECGINVYFNDKSACDFRSLYHRECLCERALLQWQRHKIFSICTC